MRPACGSVSAAKVRRVVVLPAPLRPTRPIRSPGCTRRVVGSSRMRAPARSSRSVAVIMVGFRLSGGLCHSLVRADQCRTVPMDFRLPYLSGITPRRCRCGPLPARLPGVPAMQYNDDAQLDTSVVEDARSGGGGGFGIGGLAAGGGGLGIVGLIVVVLINV